MSPAILQISMSVHITMEDVREPAWIIWKDTTVPAPITRGWRTAIVVKTVSFPSIMIIYVTFAPSTPSVDNGLICASQTCNNTGCQQKGVSYCGETTGRSQYCQVRRKCIPQPIVYIYIGWIVTPLHSYVTPLTIICCITEGKVVSPPEPCLLMPNEAIL